MPYLNVTAVESALQVAGLSYPALCSLINLPLNSFEGRATHAVRIRGGPRVRRHGLLFIGGQHAREWGSSDILVSLVARLLAAYTNGTGLTFLGKSYTTADVQSIVQNVDLFVYPDVNPDGKYYSQNTFAMWRRNRRPIPATGTIGTDVNRNYDVLWDYKHYLDPVMYDGNSLNGEVVVSDVPGVDIYHGTAPFSEVESQNVRWLLDTYPQIRYFVDVHSFSQLLYYPWGDDQNQSVAPDQNFLNPAYDGQRGPAGGTYGEFMRAQDQARLDATAQRMNGALNAVRGKSYAVGQSYLLYPTCGASTCYAFGRHIADTARTKLDAFLIEWGTTFQPDYATEMVNIIEDVSAALTELCLAADRLPILDVSPRQLNFGRLQVGTSRNRSVQLTNRGARSLTVAAVSIEAGPNAALFTLGAAPATLAAGATGTVPVTFTPVAAGARGARLLIEFFEPGQAVHDVWVVPLAGDACVPVPGTCYAPVFGATNGLVCLVLFIVLIPVIVLLALFSWIPSVRCALNQLLFRLRNCGDGNDDACIPLK